MATSLSNKFNLEVLKGTVDLLNDTLKICLMASGFTFSATTQHGWSDVSASELAEQFGYLQNTKVLTTPAMTEDDGNLLSKMTCDDVVWTASGGAIGPTPGAIIFDDTHASDIIVGYLDFGGNKTAGDGATFTISGIVISLTLDV